MDSPSDSRGDSLLDSPPSSVGELLREVKLVSKWYVIGTRLDLDTDDLDVIQISPVAEDVKASRMYKLWLDSKPYATRRQLIEVLQGMNFNRQALDYRNYIGKNFSWHYSGSVH